MKKILFLSMLISSLCLPAFAATTYYVDYTNGSDSNNGTSLATAFKTTTPVQGVNFLHPCDKVEIVRNNTFVGADSVAIFQSSGTPGCPITIEGYGSGTDPIFNGSIAQADIPSWSGWTAYDAPNHVWVSNVGLGFNTSGPIVDGTYNLMASNNLSQLSSKKYLYWQTGGLLYVRLIDDSDPNGHTFEFPKYPNANLFRGLIRTDDSGVGRYITFRHLHVYGSYVAGMSSSGIGNRFEDVLVEFTGKENIEWIANGATAPGADHNTCLRCTGRYGNTYASGGTGQGFTTEAAYGDIQDSLFEYSTHAGVDFLDYNDATHVHDNRLINSIVRYNSRQSINASSGGTDPQVYVDGGYNIQIINNTILGNASFNSTFPIASQSAVLGLSIGSEHSSTKIPYNIYLYNNVISQNTYATLEIATLNSANVIHDIWLIGNTFGYSQFNRVARIFDCDTTYGASYHIKNNIFYLGAAGGIYSTDAVACFDMNYNVYYNTSLLMQTGTDFATWKTNTGQDANSIMADPRFILPTLTGTPDYRLQRTSLGQANNSPAIGIGLVGYSQNYFITLNGIGSTATDNSLNNPATPDVGYHYNLNFFNSLNWNKGQSGTTYQ